MAQDTTTYWFVEAKGSFTNEVISRRLAEQNLGGEDRRGTEIDDKERPCPVWRVSHSFITELLASQKSMRLEFRIYNRRGGVGPIHRWKFEDQKKGKKRKPALVFG